MKKLVIDNFKFTSSYSKNKEFLIDMGINLNKNSFNTTIFDCNANVSIIKTLFNNYIEINFGDFDQNRIDVINENLMQQYAEPTHYSFECGNVWNIDDVYVCHGVFEVSYGTFFHMIRIFFSKPFCKIINYEDYKKYNDIFNEIASKWGLKYKGYSSINFDKEIYVIFENKQYQYYFSIKDNKIKGMVSKITYIDDKTVKYSPDGSGDLEYNGISSLYHVLDSYFTYMEEYDLLLYNKKYE